MFDLDENENVKPQNYEQLIEKLFMNKDDAKRFIDFNTVDDKLECLWRVPMLQELLRKSNKINEKSEGESRRYRDIGNKYFQGGNWAKASVNFSTAICFAPLNTKRQGRDLSLAFANRSAALYRMEEYNESLQDIEHALYSGYPSDLRYKVMERRIYCHQKLGNKVEATSSHEDLIQAIKNCKLEGHKVEKIMSDVKKLLETEETCPVPPKKSSCVPWLTLPVLASPHPEFNTFSDAVHITWEENKGRFGQASRDIESGELLGVEKAVTASLYEDMRADHCDACFKFIPYTSLHCDTCSSVRFCSSECKSSATEGYHGYECGQEDVYAKVLGKLLKDGKRNAESSKKFHQLSLKTITQKPFSWFKQNKKLLEARLNTSQNKSGLRSIYEDLLLLESHQDVESEIRNFYFMLSAIFHLRSLQITGYFGVKKTKMTESLTEDELFIAKLLFSFLVRAQFNTHGVVESAQDKEADIVDGLLKLEKAYEFKIRMIGNGVFPSLAMLNHSCCNNIFKVNIGNYIVLYASKNIQRGEEITENYYPVAQVIKRPERRAWLKEGYWFDCGCKACIENYPIYKDAVPHSQLFRCQKKNCSGITEDETCPLCKTKLPRSSLTAEINSCMSTLLAARQQLHSSAEYSTILQYAEIVKKNWIRLQEIISYPCQKLYQGEIIFWRSLRLSMGNKCF